MISIETEKPPVADPNAGEPHTGSEFVASAAFLYCRNCKKYHPREYFVDRGNGVVVCQRCHEAMIGVDHEQKAKEWLRQIVTFFIDEEIGNQKDVASISSLTWAKAFYNEFRGPAQCGAEVGAYFRDLMREQPNSVGVAGKLVTLMRLLTQVESNNKVPETLPTTKEGLIAHMQALAMKAVNQAMRMEATKNLAQAAQFLSENVPLSELAATFEQTADSIAEERGLVNTLGPLNAKPAYEE